MDANTEAMDQVEEAYDADDDLRSGYTEAEIRAEVEASARLAQQASDSLLTMNGGRGDGRSALIGQEVLTIEDNLAVALAKDMADDAMRRTKKGLKELTLIELNEGLDKRCDGRSVKPNQVAAELARLQNRAIYGDTVVRR